MNLIFQILFCLLQSPNDQNNAASLNSSSRSAASDVSQGCHGEQFTEIYLKREENVQCVIDVLEDYDFRVRRPAIKVSDDETSDSSLNIYHIKYTNS